MLRSPPTTEDIDNFHFAASENLAELLRGELDMDGLAEVAELTDEVHAA